MANHRAGKIVHISIAISIDQGSGSQSISLIVSMTTNTTEANLIGRLTALPLFIRMIFIDDRKYQTIFAVQSFFQL